jgi:hypothetical protein
VRRKGRLYFNNDAAAPLSSNIMHDGKHFQRGRTRVSNICPDDAQIQICRCGAGRLRDLAGSRCDLSARIDFALALACILRALTAIRRR